MKRQRPSLLKASVFSSVPHLFFSLIFLLIEKTFPDSSVSFWIHETKTTLQKMKTSRLESVRHTVTTETCLLVKKWSVRSLMPGAGLLWRCSWKLMWCCMCLRSAAASDTRLCLSSVFLSHTKAERLTECSKCCWSKAVRCSSFCSFQELHMMFSYMLVLLQRCMWMSIWFTLNSRSMSVALNISESLLCLYQLENISDPGAISFCRSAGDSSRLQQNDDRGSYCTCYEWNGLVWLSQAFTGTQDIKRTFELNDNPTGFCRAAIQLELNLFYNW